MSPVRNLVTIASAVAAITYAGASRADVTSTTVTQQQTPRPQPQPPVQPQPQVQVQQAQPPVVVQQQPAPATVTVQPPPPPASTTTTTAAPYAPAEPGGEQYGEKTVEHRPNKTLLTTGISILVVSYAASAIGGVASSRDADGYLLVPLVGPWIDLGNRNCSDRPCGDRENTNKAAIITAGIFQTAGALLTAGAFLIPESTSVSHEKRVLENEPEVHVTPISYGDGAGIGAIGRF